MANGRPPSFQFYPRDFLVDTFHLTDRQFKRYTVGLCRSWESGGYGYGTRSQWLAWMGYSSESGEWDNDDSGAIWFMFMHFRPPSTEEDPHPEEIWIQKRMVYERFEQEERHRLAASGGRKRASLSRRHGGMFTSTPPAGDQPSTSDSPSLASASAVESTEDSKEDSKSNTRPNRAREREPIGFVKFYETYPKRNGRRLAAKSFASALKRHPVYTAENLAEGAGFFAKQCADEGKDPQFIPYPATWLNQDRFREYFDEDDNPETPSDPSTPEELESPEAQGD
jgi:hypothetical protein